MRKAEIVLGTIIALWIVAGFIAGQKVFYKTNSGSCSKQPVVVPVLLDKDCKPNVLLRHCDSASDSTEAKCLSRLKVIKDDR